MENKTNGIHLNNDVGPTLHWNNVGPTSKLKKSQNLLHPPPMAAKFLTKEKKNTKGKSVGWSNKWSQIRDIAAYENATFNEIGLHVLLILYTTHTQHNVYDLMI